MTTIKGTGDGGLTQQSTGFWGQRMYALLVSAFLANGTLYLATKIGAPVELSMAVIYMEVGLGMVLVAGRTGAHMMEAWANSKLGKMESREVTEKVVTQTPPKKK